MPHRTKSIETKAFICSLVISYLNSRTNDRFALFPPTHERGSPVKNQLLKWPSVDRHGPLLEH